MKKAARKAYAVSLLVWTLSGLSTPLTTPIDDYKGAAKLSHIHKKEILQIAKGRILS